jgi:hypothetical protein
VNGGSGVDAACVVGVVKRRGDCLNDNVGAGRTLDECILSVLPTLAVIVAEIGLLGGVISTILIYS